MIRCYLGLGSNLKTPARQIRLCLNKLRCMPKSTLIKTTTLTMTKPWGFNAQPNYCNAIVQLNTTLSPFLLLNKVNHIENQQGRVRKQKFRARTLDIDILYYGNKTLKHPKLTLPHPYIQKREFILKPLQALWQDTALPLK